MSTFVAFYTRSIILSFFNTISGIRASQATHTIWAFHPISLSILCKCLLHDDWIVYIFNCFPTPSWWRQGESRLDAVSLTHGAVASEVPCQLNFLCKMFFKKLINCFNNLNMILIVSSILVIFNYVFRTALWVARVA